MTHKIGEVIDQRHAENGAEAESDNQQRGRYHIPRNADLSPAAGVAQLLRSGHFRFLSALLRHQPPSLSIFMTGWSISDSRAYMSISMMNGR